MELIDKVNKIKIEDFLAALDIKPIKREGNILTYNAPYDFDMEWGGPETFGNRRVLSIRNAIYGVINITLRGNPFFPSPTI